MCLLLFQIGVCGFYERNSDVSVSDLQSTSRAKFLVKLHERFLEWVQGFLSSSQGPKGRSWEIDGWHRMEFQ